MSDSELNNLFNEMFGEDGEIDDLLSGYCCAGYETTDVSMMLWARLLIRLHKEGMLTIDFIVDSALATGVCANAVLQAVPPFLESIGLIKLNEVAQTIHPGPLLDASQEVFLDFLREAGIDPDAFADLDPPEEDEDNLS